jgi:putative hydrolase of the HAD superfamily
LRAVVLDLDDTLLASARAAQRARARLREFGVSPRRFLAADRRWWAAYQRGEVTIDELRHNRWRDVGLYGDAARAADDVYRTVARVVNARTGARRFLKSLREHGLRTVILTNGAVEPQWNKISTAGLLPLVDAIVISEEVGFHKPHPHAFAAALERVQTKSDAAAMVGDTYENDILGALSAGFRKVIWLTRMHVQQQQRVITVGRLDDVLPALQHSG